MSESDELIGELRVLNARLESLIDTLTPKTRRSRRPAADTGPTWDAYCSAYLKEYGTEPVRNASVNASILNFVKKVGIGDAPEIARFYVENYNRYYAQRLHPVNLMCSEAEKLHTLWIKEEARKRWQKDKEAREKEEKATPERARQIVKELGLKLPDLPPSGADGAG